MKGHILLFLIFMLSFSACHKKDTIADYNAEQTFVYFRQPSFGLGNSVDRLDSLVFSFAFETDRIEEKTLAFPIQIIGQKQNYDRAVGVEVVKEQAMVPDGLLTFAPPVIRAGHFQDTLFIQIKRKADLKQQNYSLVVALYPTDSFKVGVADATKFRLFISDQLQEPNWWFNWRDVFGAYKKEVFKKWIELYPPGIDTTPPILEGDQPNFSWNNMPGTISRYYYPVTFFYVDRLREYFEKNAVYPNGDSSQPRIYLP